jgi:hypothetical protein
VKSSPRGAFFNLPVLPKTEKVDSPHRTKVAEMTF